MWKALFLFVGCGFVAQGAVLRNDNVTLKRLTRSSCDPCEQAHHGPHPPPPPLPPGPPVPPRPSGPSGFGQESHASAAASASSFTRSDQGFKGPSESYHSNQGGFNGQLRPQQNNQGYNNGATHQTGQGSLPGAQNLASQGLQGSNHCSTCGGINNAISNAKSHSGNAVALSVNG